MKLTLHPSATKPLKPPLRRMYLMLFLGSDTPHEVAEDGDADSDGVWIDHQPTQEDIDDKCEPNERYLGYVELEL